MRGVLLMNINWGSPPQSYKMGVLQRRGTYNRTSHPKQKEK